MGRVFIFDIDDTVIIHTKERNDYYTMDTQDSLKNLLDTVDYNKIYIYTNGTYGHGKNVIQNLNINVDGIFGRDTIPYMKPRQESFLFVKNIIDQQTNMNDEFIFFDDLVENLYTAKQVGWKTVWITRNFNQKPDFVDYSFPNIYQALIVLQLKK